MGYEKSVGRKNLKWSRLFVWNDLRHRGMIGSLQTSTSDEDQIHRKTYTKKNQKWHKNSDFRGFFRIFAKRFEHFFKTFIIYCKIWHFGRINPCVKLVHPLLYINCLHYVSKKLKQVVVYKTRIYDSRKKVTWQINSTLCYETSHNTNTVPIHKRSLDF